MRGWDELRGWVTIRPLATELPPPTWTGSAASPFRARWADTVSLLVDEVKELEPTKIVLELDLTEKDLRLDGVPRSGVDIGPGVVLSLLGSFEGDLRYPCSTFRDWQGNVRGIALSLEALRKVDRYGVTQRGEQYAGWKQLPAPGDTARSRGEELIRQHGSAREAQRATHPDVTHDDGEDFRAVQAAITAGAQA